METIRSKPAPPWTDEELGYVADTLGAPVAEVAADLGRSVRSVYRIRGDVKYRGGAPSRTRQHWTASEDAIIHSTLNLPSADVAELLPGRTVPAVQGRRSKLGAKMPLHPKALDPQHPAGRPLIARTCSKCGLLLPSRWFYFSEKKKGWSADCKKCASASSVARGREDGPAGDRRRKYSSMNRDRYSARASEITRALATRKHEPYLDEDFQVLADTSLTAFAKALILKRTYFGVRGALRLGGYKSHKALGDPAHDVWIIHNPNLHNLDAIRESLIAAEKEAVSRESLWDWDDAA